MAMTRATQAAMLSPETIEQIFVQPVLEKSLAGKIFDVRPVSGSSYRIPVITDDAGAEWTEDSEEILPSDVSTKSINVYFGAVKGLTKMPSELADDSNEDAATWIGDSLSRSTAKQIDAAALGNLAAPAPKGLASLTTVATVDTADSLTETGLDQFVRALAAAGSRGAVINSWVCSEATATELALVKQGEGSNVPLMASNVNEDNSPSRLVLGRELYTHDDVPDDVVWGIPRDRAVLAIRKDVEIKVSDDAYFSSDEVAIRSVTRVGIGFRQPEAIVRMRFNQA